MSSASATTTIDFNDPLFLHPSDTPGINLVNEQLNGNEIYGIWSRAMLIALRAKNKFGFIYGSCKKPAAISPLIHQWERCNAIVLSWIMNTISKELFSGIVYATDAQNVCKDLKERFDKVNGSRIFSLHREIGSLTQGNTTVSVYYTKLKQLRDEYTSLVTLPSCGCETSKAYLEHDQQQKLLQFLVGLHESYSSIRSQILMMSPLPSVGQAYSIICQEESHRGIMARAPSHSDTPAVFYSHLHTQKTKDDAINRCEHCHWTGHKKENCYRLIGYPPGHKYHKGKKGGNFNYANQKFTKGGEYNMKPMVNNSIADSNIQEELHATPVTFTPAQYQQILRLLSQDTSVAAHLGPAANLAGIFANLMNVCT
ncbi:UBN2_3 domain-containing protein [Cephalotus follicularis]|uniref:UBN2_3 domain-containing protein n=1 Tax=Cephalotus follicularis TaxID=3775 RepID=A0A1Q3AR18_CEPFO|nr:UBN2_3 domain-containing protein [Cephalotus follicularis]